LTQEREDLTIKISKNELEIKSGEEKINLVKESLKKQKDELEEVLEKIAKNKAGAENQSFSDKKEKTEVDLKNIDEEIQKAREEINELNKKEEEKRTHLFKLQREGQTLQQKINELTNELNGLKIEATKYETKLEDLETEIRETMDNIMEIRENRTEGEINTEETGAKIKHLENQYNLIGGIDPEAEKEYEEIKERYDFLYGQVSDSEAAIKSLEDIIRELDKKIRERFEKEFKIICKKFEEYFKILFNGGVAKVIKVTEESSSPKTEEEKTEEETAEETKREEKKDETREKIKKLSKYNATGLSGIEIQACPPGKKIKSLSMLSGGEKALTAIAIICAIISANPSPFVVLDEVDATLDEANSERLARILDDLSHKTQFILITHNRATMRKADVLYGITMQDNGVSKLLSVKLEDYIKK
jgi:chromosome segregation protein